MSALDDKRFHTVVDGVVRLQGEVIETLGNGLILCQLFSFVTGNETDKVIININDHVYKTGNGGSGIFFYEDDNEMNDRYYSHWCKTPQAKGVL